jgi:cytoskeleton protein RodZ
MGFVRAYANHLGLDGDRVLARYKADTAEVHTRPDLALPVPLGERSLPGGPILLVALILALCGYGTWYYLSTGERSRPERVAAVPADLRQAIAPSAAPPNVAAPPASLPAPVPPPPEQMAGSPAPRLDPEAAGQKPPALVPGPDLRPPERVASDLPRPDPSAVAAPATPLASRSATNAGPDPIVFPGSPPAPPPVAATSEPPPVPALASTPPKPAAPAGSGLTAPAAPGSGVTVPAAPAPGPSGAEARVAIRALADCWIQVRGSDQAILFSRVLKAGEIYHVPPRTGLALRTGNAGALAIEVDGKAAPSIGGIGTLRRNVALDPDALAAGTAVHG